MQNAKIFEPPVTNRGVENTTGSEISQILEPYILVDWIQCTFFVEDNVYVLFKELFNVDIDDVGFEDRGIYFYNETYYFKNIKMLINTKRDDMGIHLLMSGSACRDFEDLNLSYEILFKRLLTYGVKFTRLDISVDVFDKTLFTTDKIQNCIKNNEVVSRFKNTTEFKKTNLGNSKSDGYTIWFGSRSSEIQIVFYDKYLERQSVNVKMVDGVDFWNRLECRFRNRYADDIAHNIVDSTNFKKFYFSIINNYISFVDYNATDKNRSRWKLKEWWSKFLENSDKIRFSNVNFERTITKVDNWLDKSVSRSLLLLYLANYKNDYSYDNYIKYLKKGYVKLSHKDILFINDYRKTKDYEPLNEIDISKIIQNL